MTIALETLVKLFKEKPRDTVVHVGILRNTDPNFEAITGCKLEYFIYVKERGTTQRTSLGVDSSVVERLYWQLVYSLINNGLIVVPEQIKYTQED